MKEYIRKRAKEKTTKFGFLMVAVAFAAPYLTGMQINAITYLGIALIGVPGDILTKIKQ